MRAFCLFSIEYRAYSFDRRISSRYSNVYGEPFIMYRLSNGPDRGAAKRTGSPVRGAGSTHSRRVCVTLAFAVVRSCGRDSMPIQSSSFGLLWK